MIVVRAPLRISLGGGGTDLPFYSSKFGGSLISAAINKYIYIIVEKREFYDEFIIRYSKIEVVKNINNIKHSRIREALKYLDIKEPLEITSLADAPAGTGLGSSGSFLVALLKALHTYKGENISSKKLAEEAADIEMNILKEPIGKQDQYLAAFGNVLNLEIEKNGNVIASTIDSSYSTLEELESNLLLFSTGIKHSTIEIISDQKKNLESDEKKMHQMHLVKEIGKEIKSMLEEGNASKVGKWLNVHWEAKKKFSNKMTSNKINSFYKLGIKNGALGGKLVGAGGGGFLMFYCEKNKEKLRKAMKKAGLKEMPFRFDNEGCKVLYQGK